MRGGLRFFLDRGLGSRILPSGLRRAGWLVETMAERYGVERSQSVADVEWITEAADRGDVLLANDRAIAKKPLEVEAIRMSSARVFVIASANITGPQMLERLLANESAIERAALREGPYVYGVDVATLHRIKLRLE